MPDRSLTYSRGGTSPMPAQPAWFHRLDEILSALRPIESTHLDRQAVEKLFRVRQRRARQSFSRACGSVTPRRCRGRLSSRVWSRRRPAGFSSGKGIAAPAWWRISTACADSWRRGVGAFRLRPMFASASSRIFPPAFGCTVQLIPRGLDNAKSSPPHHRNRPRVSEPTG